MWHAQAAVHRNLEIRKGSLVIGESSESWKHHDVKAGGVGQLGLGPLGPESVKACGPVGLGPAQNL